MLAYTAALAGLDCRASIVHATPQHQGATPLRRQAPIRGRVDVRGRVPTHRTNLVTDISQVVKVRNLDFLALTAT